MTASFVRNTPTKNYQNLIIGFHVTVENVGDVFLEHSVLEAQFAAEVVKIMPYIRFRRSEFCHNKSFREYLKLN